MLLQTNSYVVPKDKRNEHALLVRRFRQSLAKLGCGHFEVYEQVSQNWSGQDSGGRYVQIICASATAGISSKCRRPSASDPVAQALIQEFCELINFPFQQQQGLFAVGFYNSVLPAISLREPETQGEDAAPLAATADAPTGESSTGDLPQADSPEAFPEDVPVDPPARRADGRGGLRPTVLPRDVPNVAPIFFDATVRRARSSAPEPKLAAASSIRDHRSVRLAFDEARSPALRFGLAQGATSV